MKFTKSICLGLISLVSILGLNITTSSASTSNGILEVNENTPLYLEHAANMTIEKNQDLSILAWHYSHSSHASHASHTTQRMF